MCSGQRAAPPPHCSPPRTAYDFLTQLFYFSPLWAAAGILAVILHMRRGGASGRQQALVALLLVLALYHPVRNWPWLRRHPLWRVELRKWNIHVIDERLGTPGDAYGRAWLRCQKGLPARLPAGGCSSPRGTLFAFEPHAVFPFGPALGAVHRLGDYFQQFRALGASVVGWVPIIRSLAGTGAGMVSVDAASIRRQWRRHPQRALAIVPGGIGEMFYADTPLRTADGRPLEETLLLAGRKGFIRLALEQGAAIVPVFVFGSSATFKLWPKWAWLRQLSRSIGVFLGIPFGAWGLPIPMAQPLLYVVGEALDPATFMGAAKLPAAGVGAGCGSAVTCAPARTPSAAEVELAHAAFLQRLREMFDKYKGLYGWAEAQLRIV